MPFFPATKHKKRLWDLLFAFPFPIIVDFLHPLKKKVAMLAVWLIIYPVMEQVFPMTFPSIRFEFLNDFLINKVLINHVNDQSGNLRKQKKGTSGTFSKVQNIFSKYLIYYHHLFLWCQYWIYKAIPSVFSDMILSAEHKLTLTRC